MHDITRTVRFCVGNSPDPGLFAAHADAAKKRHNSFAAWPSMTGLGAFYELEVSCRGLPDQATGYLLNISAIDQAVRSAAIPIVQRGFTTARQPSLSDMLSDILKALQSELGAQVSAVTWRLTPYYSLAMHSQATDRVLISQQFEFSATHRLHVDSFSPERNREVFGKCNNPNGHGHNYRIEPAVSVPLDSSTRGEFTLQDLERIVDQTIIQRFDHKHLNLDTAEFKNLNPSVENIARVCHDLLREPLEKAGARLARVTVWETEKTRCTYPASA